MHNSNETQWMLAFLCTAALVTSCQPPSHDTIALRDEIPPLPSCPEVTCPEPTCPPLHRSVIPPQDTLPNAPGPRPDPNTNTASTPQRVPINHATAQELTTLPGIGPKTAERIIAARKKRPFRSTRDIMRVKGIGRSTWNKLKDRITAQNPPSPPKHP